MFLISIQKKMEGSENALEVKYFEEGTNSKYMTTVSFCKYRTRSIRLDRFLFLDPTKLWRRYTMGSKPIWNRILIYRLF